ncbi:hypothetical protein O3G_MSEX000282 [Manduca sexta]|nr:hypothetical protein O3G_MSEX000282 [Manduca sexta]
MTHSEEFESTIRLTQFTLLISGIKLYRKKWNFLIDILVQKFLFYLNMITLYPVLIAEIYLLIEALQKGGSFVEHSLMTPCITVSILGTVKVCFLYKNSDILLEIIDKLSEIHPKFNNDVEIANEDRETTNEEKVTKDSMRLLNLNMLVLIGSGVCVVTMFCLMPFILMMIGYYQDGVLKIQYPYLVKYFFDAYSIRLWYLEYIHQVYAS